MALTTIGSVGGGPARSITEGLTKRGIDARSKIVEGLLITSLGVSLLILVVLVVDIVQRSWPVWTNRPGDFVRDGLNSSTLDLSLIHI